MQEIWNFLVPIIGVESYVAASSHLFPAQGQPTRVQTSSMRKKNSTQILFNFINT